MSAVPYKVGDRVVAFKSIYQEADECAPGGYLCRAGDLLIVRHVDGGFKGRWPIAISHERITNNSFRVDLNEVMPAPEAAAKPTEPTQGEQSHD